MRTMKFLNLCLLSQVERRGLKISFDMDCNIIVGGNQFGKSAILKSLYYAFGAKPHRIDKRWRDARVNVLVEADIDGMHFKVLRTPSYVAVFDTNNVRMIETDDMHELGRFWSRILNFGMLLNGPDNKPVSPTAAFIFAPFYVDQDRSWTTIWSSFEGLNFPRTKQALAEYHTGIKTSAYYRAWSLREGKIAEARALLRGRDGLHRALSIIDHAIPEVGIVLDIDLFSSESQELITRTNDLFRKQVNYRGKLASLYEKKRLWGQQQNLVARTLREMSGSLQALLELPEHVNCPTCGTQFSNDIASQFDLVRDEDALLMTSHQARENLVAVDGEIDRVSLHLKDIENSIVHVNNVLSIKKESVTFDDIVKAKGREEAKRTITSQINEIDRKIGLLDGEARDLKEEMGYEANSNRAKEIQAKFSNMMRSFEAELDVSRFDEAKNKISTPALGRGSETPRSLFSYYYSVLNSCREFSSGPFCPIVIDSPNQQGQDKEHLGSIMRFVFSRRPHEAQVIVAAEDLVDLGDIEARHIHIEGEERHVLREEQYGMAMDEMRTYLGLLL